MPHHHAGYGYATAALAAAYAVFHSDSTIERHQSTKQRLRQLLIELEEPESTGPAGAAPASDAHPPGSSQASYGEGLVDEPVEAAGGVDVVDE